MHNILDRVTVRHAACNTQDLSSMTFCTINIEVVSHDAFDHLEASTKEAISYI